MHVSFYFRGFTPSPPNRLTPKPFTNLSPSILSHPSFYAPYFNKQMTSLSLGDMPELYDLQFSNTLIDDINLSATPKLNAINFQNSRLRSIDFSGTPNLRSLTCSNDSLVALDLSGVYLTFTNLRFATSNRTVTLAAGNKLDLTTLAKDGLDVSRM